MDRNFLSQSSADEAHGQKQSTKEHCDDSCKNNPKNNYKVINPADIEQVRNLKEGEIVVDQDGKRYRAKKTIYLTQCIGGPKGFGHPEDRSLRKIERDVLIPEIMAKQVARTECRIEYAALIQCLRNEGDFKGPHKCRPYHKIFDDCKYLKFQNDDFREKVTNQFLDERAELRRTGLNSKQRKFREYLQWKEKNGAKG